MRKILLASGLLLPVLLAACTDNDSAALPGNLAAEGDATRGAGLYASNCAACHGARAEGTDKGPGFLDKIYGPRRHADVAFMLATRKGIRAHHWPFGDMPAQPQVDDQMLRDIVAWVRERQKEAGIIP